MEYKWNENNLQLKLKIANILKLNNLSEYYQDLLNHINIQEQLDFNKEDIKLKDKLSNIDYDECFNNYIRGLYYIPDELYEDMLDLFTWFEDFNSLHSIPKYQTINLSNDELVTLTHDIIASLKNKEALKIFNKLIKSNNLNIQKTGLNTTTPTERLGGLTYLHPYSRKSVVNLFRANTIEDIETLTHESFHFIYNYLLHQYYQTPNIHMLTELEGQYGSIYAIKYLEQINYPDVELLKKDQIDSILKSSFLLMVNHTLFKTANKSEFNLKLCEEELNKIFQSVKVSILPDELPEYLTISGFETITDMISYLVALELSKNYEPSLALSKIASLKLNDSTNLLTTFQNENINFLNDGYKDFIKEYKLTHNL